MRLIALTTASLFLLAAGDATTTTTATGSATGSDSILAPMSAAAAAAANAALAASLPASTLEAVLDNSLPEAPEFEIENADAAPAGRNPGLSLGQLVSTMTAPSNDAMDADFRCLATAVYFESRDEPLEGQLAVAQAIINRVESGRYASSVCGVVRQRGQFSFDHSRTPASGTDWRKAQAIARIAIDDMHQQVAPRAISFHAARLSPGWRGKTVIARIGNHVFYR